MWPRCAHDAAISFVDDCMNTSTTSKATVPSVAGKRPGPVHVCDLGLSDYAAAWALQKKLQQALIMLKRRPGSLPARQYLLFVEHPHVYTLGKSGKREHLLISEAGLKQRQATFVHIDRGGDITYHGPGQIVGYIIMDLEQHFTDIGKYLRGLEEIIIRTLADFGIEGGRQAGMTGVWVGGSKICAMGIKCSRWVTMHGFALNLSTDLSYFGHIVPCGLAGKPVCSMQQLLGGQQVPDAQAVKRRLEHHFGTFFGVDTVPVSKTELISPC